MAKIERVKNVVVGLLFLSLMNVLLHGKLNGDYLGVDFNYADAIVVFVLNLLIYLGMFKWLISLGKSPKLLKEKNTTTFILILTVILLLRLYAAVFFGYGMATASKVVLSGWLGLLLKITNRINVELILIYLLFIKSKYRWPLTLLMILYYLSRQSVGFLYFFIIIFLINSKTDKLFRFRLFVMQLSLLFFSQPLIWIMNWRNKARGFDEIVKNVSSVIIGRLSSFSDTVYLFANTERQFLDRLTIWEPFDKLLLGIFGIQPLNTWTTETLSISQYVGARVSDIAFMNGVLGNIIIYSRYSYLALLLYVLFIVISLMLLTFISRYISKDMYLAYVIVFSYAIVSGVLYDFYSLFVTLFLILFINGICRLLSRRRTQVVY
jgi:hypothetical protein